MLSAQGMTILFFAGTILVGLSATADPRLEAQSVEATVPSAVIPKTNFSDKFRLIFLAGLEGSGHHYLRGVTKSVFRANPDLHRIQYSLAAKPFYLPHCMGGSATNYAKAELQAIEGMQMLAQEAASLSGPTFYPQRHTLSYPENWGPGKVLQYSDLRMFANAAEMEGLDLRVVYLKRSAHDMIIANTVHRHFQMLDPHETSEKLDEEAFLEYVRILFTDAAVLQSFLGEIDPRFIVCHDWDSLGEEQQASKIAAFISPNDEVADMVSSALVNKVVEKPHTDDGEDQADIDDLTFDGAESLVSRLQDKLDSFEVLYCDPKRAV